MKCNVSVFGAKNFTSPLQIFKNRGERGLPRNLSGTQTRGLKRSRKKEYMGDEPLWQKLRGQRLEKG